MVLLIFPVVGIFVGVVLTKWKGQPYHPPKLVHTWLAYVAFIPQFLAIYFKQTRNFVPDELVAISLVVSNFLLILFVWSNRCQRGMIILMIGAMLNISVILANSGFMPISLRTAERLIGDESLLGVDPGSRFGKKDILLEESDIHLEWLSDRYLLPDHLIYKVAFSIGDVCIALGAFWMFANWEKMTQERK